MPLDVEEKFQAILKIGDNHPSFVLWAGSLDDAEKWDRMIHFLAEAAREGAETGFDTYPLLDELAPGLLCLQVSNAFRDMGVELPKAFPAELDPYFTGSDDEGPTDSSDDPDDSHVWELLEANSYSATISAIFDSLNDVWAFYAAYVEDVVDDDDGPISETKENMEARIIDLAASKIEIDEGFAPKIRSFRHRVMENYEEWLTAVKGAAFRDGTPLKAELLDMVGNDAGELALAAEREAWGYNATRLHPDIYMNELLVGIRVIHQVLPAILKKLDVNDFTLDQSDLRIDRRTPSVFAKVSVEADVPPAQGCHE
jgi:hypothetical protein